MTSFNTYSWFSSSQRSNTALEDITPDTHNDLISFLGYMQRVGVDFLPITWQPALGDVGRGASARISQAPIKLGTSFAFKRARFDGINMEDCFERSVKEALILRHAWLINHENFIKLEAFCLEIFSEPERLLPVLVFDNFPLGNLQDFLLSEASITFDERLRFCADIAKALSALHIIHIIHGDIKPLNALVFELDGKRIVKLADFGDASICDNVDSLALLPKSIPWNAPEHHIRGISFSEGTKMDIYSFGMLCLWTIFVDYFSLVPTNPEPSQHGSRFIHGLSSTVARLAILKRSQAMEDVAKECVRACKSITAGQQTDLSTLFAITLAEDPNLRSNDFQVMLKLLNDDRSAGFDPYRNWWQLEDGGTWKKVDQTAEKLPQRAPIKKHWAPSIRQLTTNNQWEGSHPKFKLAEYMTVLLHVDRRIRVGIVQELLERYRTSRCLRCKQHAASQVALSYHTGYGIQRNLEQSHSWLELSDMPSTELESQIEFARSLILPPYVNVRLRELQSQFIMPVDHAHAYRMIPGSNIADIKTALADEVRDIGITFGETHMMTVVLTRTLAEILHKYGLFHEAAKIQESLVELLKKNGDTDNAMKVLADLCHTYSAQDRLQMAERYREKVAEYYTQNLGEEHMGTLGILTNLAHTQTELGRWTQAEATLLRVTGVASRIVGDEHTQTLTAKSILAAVYVKQGRLELAHDLQSQILDARVKTLGADHESTWYSMANLAAIQFAQGRFSEAEKLDLKVVELRTNLLGLFHPVTLTSMYNLARTYGKNNNSKMEEEMLTTVLDARKAVLGSEHEDTTTTAVSLARNLRFQRQFKRAEALETENIQIMIEKLGKAHPSVLKSRTDLMWIHHDQGNFEVAEAVQLDNIAVGEGERGAKDQNVLRCMSALASMYKVRARFAESLELYEKVLQNRVNVLGQTHQDTIKTAQNIRTVKALAARQNLRGSDREL